MNKLVINKRVAIQALTLGLLIISLMTGCKNASTDSSNEVRTNFPLQRDFPDILEVAESDYISKDTIYYPIADMSKLDSACNSEIYDGCIRSIIAVSQEDILNNNYPSSWDERAIMAINEELKRQNEVEIVRCLWPTYTIDFWYLVEKGSITPLWGEIYRTSMGYYE